VRQGVGRQPKIDHLPAIHEPPTSSAIAIEERRQTQRAAHRL
jgi:hypothetical protein